MLHGSLVLYVRLWLSKYRNAQIHPERGIIYDEYFKLQIRSNLYALGWRITPLVRNLNRV